MSERDELLAKYKDQAVAQLGEAGVSNIDHDVLDDLVGRMKTIIANKDAILVAASDPAELETVRRNFVVKKLGVESESKGSAAVNAVAAKMAGSKFKNRAAFYYLVKQELS